MRVSYADDYYVPLPPEHPFPMGKFPALREILLEEGLLRSQEMVEPEEASWELLEQIHTRDYLDGLEAGSLGQAAQRKMGLPWSRALVRRSRLAVQGTLNAASMALEDGVAANLAGGTHHAFAGHGEGFCVLNDVAIAIRSLTDCGLIRRSLVIDLDVHQGNGTAAILEEDQTAVTFSVHGERNYPFQKVRSTLDVALPDDTNDREYLSVIELHLPDLFSVARPDLVFFLAGVDTVEGDRYGRLSMSRAGLHLRERMILEFVRERGVPVVLLMSGGYAPTAEETADLHAVAHREAREIFGDAPSGSTTLQSID